MQMFTHQNLTKKVSQKILDKMNTELLEKMKSEDENDVFYKFAHDQACAEICAKHLGLP